MDPASDPQSSRSVDARIAFVLLIGLVAAAWTLDVVQAVGPLRAEENARVEAIRQLEGDLKVLHSKPPGDPAVGAALDSMRDLALEFDERAPRTEPVLRAVRDLERALEQHGTDKGDTRAALVVVADDFRRELWRQHDEFVTRLDLHWRSLRLLALAALGLAGLALLLVFAVRRQRRAAEELGSRLRQALADTERAQRRAESASHAKTEFLATISHEIRTPMTAILGSTELLEAQTTEPEQRQHLAVIRTGGDALLSLINEVLDLSSIEAGRFQARPEDFELTPMLDDVARLFVDRARARGLALEVRIDPELPEYVHGDVGRIRQVLLNLVGNAVKFTQQGEVRLVARGVGELIRFQVEDTGPGLPPGAERRIFEPFEQLEPGRRGKGGSGLGLAISRKLVEALGGSLQVHSETNQGCRFWFDLELPIAAPRTSMLSVDTLRAPGRRSVLIVDDNATNRQVLGGLLRTLNCEVGEAESAFAALDSCRERAWDLVFMDIDMPEVDGFEATRAIRELGGHCAELPIVGLSGHATEDARAEGLAAGMNDYLSKPLRRDALDAAVSRWTDRA